MKTKQVVQTASDITLSKTVLLDTPMNAYRFLKGAVNAAIAKQLASVGYDKAAHLEGWTLFYAVSNAPSSAITESPENVALQAIGDIQTWNVQGFRRTRAVLDRKFPDVSKVVFADIDETNNGPVYELATYLDRIGDLESSPERKATRKQDHGALEALAARGLDEVLFKELRAMLASVQVQATALEATPADERITAVNELYLWLRDWKETARAVIRNKSQLRMLGIGGKSVKKASSMTPVAPSAPTTPVTVTPSAPTVIPPAVPLAPIAQLTQGAPASDAAKVA